jgi:uridine kinase
VEVGTAAAIVVDAVRAHTADASRPVVVAIDGRSGAGKTAIAAAVASDLGGIVVPTDDFCAANLGDADWDSRSAAQRAADAVDWRRLRIVLESLLSGRPATWQPFDFNAKRPDGTFAMSDAAERREPVPLIILEGAYATHPAVLDLIDLTVVVEITPDARRRRLVDRDGEAYTAEWMARWVPAEDFYFTMLRPPSSFDLVVAS